MEILVRAALLLAVTVPLFAVSHFHAPPLWQIFVAAVLGSALGQLVVRDTRGRPAWIRMVIAAGGFLFAAGSVAYFFPPEWRPAPANRRLVVVASEKPPTLTLDDATALERVAGVAAIAPVEHKKGTLTTGSENWVTSVVGTTPAYLDVRGWRVARGSPFSQDDLVKGAPVMVLGKDPAHALFGGSDPVGQIVTLKPLPMTVVGVLADTGNPNDDDTVLVPLTTFQRHLAGFGPPRFGGKFVILLHDGATIDPISALLRDRHRLAPDAEDDFRVVEPK